MNQWTHLATVWDGKQSHLYVGGRASGRPLSIAEFKELSWIEFGGGRMEPFVPNFELDEIRVSNVARFTANFRPERRLSRDAATLALYHVDEGQGGVLVDSSGNNHHGKIAGATWLRARNHDLCLPFDGFVYADAPITYDGSHPLTIVFSCHGRRGGCLY